MSRSSHDIMCANCGTPLKGADSGYFVCPVCGQPIEGAKPFYLTYVDGKLVITDKPLPVIETQVSPSKEVR